MKCRIDSARDTERFAWSTADWISDSSSSASRRSATERPRVAVLRGPLVERGLVDGDEGGDERPGVADDDRLADQLVRTEAVLERGRGHVLAGRRDEELLLPAGDPQEPVVVELADVAGEEPAASSNASAVAVGLCQ